MARTEQPAALMTVEQHLAEGDRLLDSAAEQNYVWAGAHAALAAAHFAAATAKAAQHDRLASRAA